MSAQVISALLARANLLTVEAATIRRETGGASEFPVQPGEVPRNADVLDTIAREFRTVAYLAQGLEPPP